MKKIILFDTSIGTLNHGDEVIVRSFKNNARELLEKNFVLSFPTHTPCFLSYQQFDRNKRFSFVNSADHKFVLGTNIINNYMLSPWPYWNINILNSKCYKNAVLVGVGSNGIGKDNKLRWYSKMLYKSILSNKYTHSVRDEKTKEILESIGLKAINTGCPTIWGLTKEHCRTIPQRKARGGVVFTLTDYAVDYGNDQKLIDLLVENYKTVMFWPQGAKDYEYFMQFRNIEDISVVPPAVDAYNTILDTDVDYIGTRLHAGIYAIQHRVRSIILAVDNRARDMSVTYNLNVYDRNDIESIEKAINSHIITDVRINQEKINYWKKQFI